MIVISRHTSDRIMCKYIHPSTTPKSFIINVMHHSSPNLPVTIPSPPFHNMTNTYQNTKQRHLSLFSSSIQPKKQKLTKRHPSPPFLDHFIGSLLHSDLYIYSRPSRPSFFSYRDSPFFSAFAFQYPCL